MITTHLIKFFFDALKRKKVKAFSNVMNVFSCSVSDYNVFQSIINDCIAPAISDNKLLYQAQINDILLLYSVEIKDE